MKLRLFSLSMVLVVALSIGVLLAAVSCSPVPGSRPDPEDRPDPVQLPGQTGMVSLDEFLGILLDHTAAGEPTGRTLRETYEQATDRGWLQPREIPDGDAPVPLTWTVAARTGVRVLESQGLTRYPYKTHLFYETWDPPEELSGSLANYRIHAHVSGILPLEEVPAGGDGSEMPRPQAEELLNRILDPTARIIPVWVDPSEEEHLRALRFDPPRQTAFAADTVQARMVLENTAGEARDLWAGLSFQDPAGQWHDVTPQRLSVAPGESVEISMDWTIPDDAMGGRYRTTMALWDSDPRGEGARRLAHGELPDALLVHRGEDPFESFDRSLWHLSSTTLGRTQFSPDRVEIGGGRLLMHLEPYSFRGGELRSNHLMQYGAYEIRMRAPDARSSITGFFMYKAPDYYFEIDIEIYNDPDRGWFLTTYADGSIQNEYHGELPFDPTAGYHTYRFEYEPDRLTYYVDDVFVLRWTSGIPQEPMYLMLNCWYPNWLEGETPGSPQALSVDYIRY